MLKFILNYILCFIVVAFKTWKLMHQFTAFLTSFIIAFDSFNFYNHINHLIFKRIQVTGVRFCYIRTRRSSRCLPGCSTSYDWRKNSKKFFMYFEIVWVTNTIFETEVIANFNIIRLKQRELLQGKSLENLKLV